jgi:hypothetical protein
MSGQNELIGIKFKTHNTVYILTKKIVDDHIAIGFGKQKMKAFERESGKKFLDYDVIIVDEDDRLVTMSKWNNPEDNIFQYTQE